MLVRVRSRQEGRSCVTKAYDGASDIIDYCLGDKEHMRERAFL